MLGLRNSDHISSLFEDTVILGKPFIVGFVSMSAEQNEGNDTKVVLLVALVHFIAFNLKISAISLTRG